MVKSCPGDFKYKKVFYNKKSVQLFNLQFFAAIEQLFITVWRCFNYHLCAAWL